MIARSCNALRGQGVCGRKARRKVPGYQQYRCAQCYSFMLRGAMRRVTMARRYLASVADSKRITP